MDLNTMITIANGGFVVLMIVLMIAGYKNGLILSLLNCLGWIVALAAATLLAPSASKILTLYPLALTPMNDSAFGPVMQQMLNQVVWFILIAALVKLICFILKPLAKGFQKIPVLGFFNQILGAAFGVVNMWIWTSIVCLVLSLPAFPLGKQIIDGSLLKSASLVSDLISEKIEISPEEVNELMSLIEQMKNLDDETISDIQDFLEDYGITQNQIDELFKNLE